MQLTTSLLALCATLAAASPMGEIKSRGTTGGINWGSEKIRGVNIGGWLVLEPFITPGIFEKQDASVVDEYTLCQRLGKKACHDQVLKPHWDSWVKLSDFQKIRDSGFNLVRVPIGFWAYNDQGTPYSSGAAPYMDRAIDFARQTGLKVIVDLHGAPGSQNGFDNSGHRTSQLDWQKGNNIKRTLDVLYTIQKKYGKSDYDDVVAGIELINEPLIPALNMDVARQYFRDGYGQQRTVSQSRVVVIQDGFEDDDSYNSFLSPGDHNAQNVAMDHHEYQCFNDDFVAMEAWQHRQYVCNNAHVYSNADKWTFVGEWSAAQRDCAQWLNGRGIGARYDGTYPGSKHVGSCEGTQNINSWPQYWRDDVRGYIEAQMESFEKHSQGWVFWNFKTEGGRAPEWDVFSLIDHGIFPQPLSDRKFSMIC